MGNEITWEQFKQVDIRIGTIIDVREFPQAHKPAYQLIVDLGSEIGKKSSSAQITNLYTKEQLIGQQVICVCNFEPKQIGPFISEILVTGFYTPQGVVLAQPQRRVPNGSRPT